MNWNKNKSILLSKFCIFGFLIICFLVGIFAPRLTGMVLYNDKMIESLMRYFLWCVYTLMIPAVAALYFLYRLLDNISRSEVFIAQNIFYLRILSWCCFFAALILTLSALYYVPFVIAGFGAAFMGLILRVVKNVFAEAVFIKEENDYTV